MCESLSDSVDDSGGSKMIGWIPKEHQMSIFEVTLESFIDMNHEPVLLSKQIDWEAVESKFTECYCADNGRLSVPIRKMVGMMRNFLKGTLGDAFNTMMAAAAYNMRHWMNKNAVSVFVSWMKTLVGRFEKVILRNENESACLCPALAMNE